MRSMSLARRPLLNLPVALLQVLDDCLGDLVLVALRERPAHPTDELGALPEAKSQG